MKRITAEKAAGLLIKLEIVEKNIENIVNIQTPYKVKLFDGDYPGKCSGVADNIVGKKVHEIVLKYWEDQKDSILKELEDL